MDFLDIFKTNTDLDAFQFFLRTIVVGIFLVIVGKMIPRRAAGGMSAFDFTFFWMMGGLIASPLFDPKISFRDTIVATLTILMAHKIIAILTFNYPKLDEIVKGRAILLINNGHLDYKTMTTNLINNEILLSEIRKNDEFKLSNIQFAYFENNGHLSITTYPEFHSVTKQDMNLPIENTVSPQLVVSDGKVDMSSLIRTDINSAELLKEIHKNGYNLRDILLCYWEGSKNLIIKRRQKS